jgi:uncharacterized protein YlaN (UPF0358 family)
MIALPKLKQFNDLEITVSEYPAIETISDCIMYSSRRSLLLAFKLNVKYVDENGGKEEYTDNCLNIIHKFGMKRFMNRMVKEVYALSEIEYVNDHIKKT